MIIIILYILPNYRQAHVVGIHVVPIIEEDYKRTRFIFISIHTLQIKFINICDNQAVANDVENTVLIFHRYITTVNEWTEMINHFKWNV